MGYDLTIRAGVKLADKIFDSLQPYVMYSAWWSDDGYGKPMYLPSVKMKALVDMTARRRRTSAGQEVSVKAEVTILRPLPIVGGAVFQYPTFEMGTFETGSGARENPIDPRDVIILPDGTTGPIVEIKGFVDRGTNHPFFSEVWLGA
jgi:hypothetical protein